MKVTITEIASGLQFPEGPVAMPDGSVVVAEIFGERVVRVRADGSIDVVADVPGGPNGLAVGPEGALYVCNNGGAFTAVERDGLLFPGPFDPDRYSGGRIQRLERDGTLGDLYSECSGRPLRSPNDLVMDGHGGFYFSDFGVRDVRGARMADLGAVFYARCDGSRIDEVVYPVQAPNGVGLSPDGSTLYYAETYTGRVYRRRVVEPGVLEAVRVPDTSNPWTLLCGLPGLQMLDSLAVDAQGWVCVGTLLTGAITAISPDGATVDQVETGDPMTTNLCFGGPEMRTAYVTLSATGRLVAMEWPRQGLRLAHC